MTLLVAGTIRVPPEHVSDLRPHMKQMAEATRAEDGCLDYSYAEDVLEAGLIRVFERWRDEVALASHFQTEHMARWRAAWPQFGVTERKLAAYDVTGERII